MVDRTARDRFAMLLRQLAAGQVTTDAFDIQASLIVLETQDAALRELQEEATGLYHDLWPYRLRGRNRLDPATRRKLARQWPTTGPLGLGDLIAGFAVIVGTIVMIGAWGWPGVIAGASAIVFWLILVHFRDQAWHRRLHAALDADPIWPFADRTRLAAARRLRTYLAGTRATMTSRS